jgi:hypothetical protein
MNKQHKNRSYKKSVTLIKKFITLAALRKKLKKKKKKKKLHGLIPRANYTDRATAARHRS